MMPRIPPLLLLSLLFSFCLALYSPKSNVILLNKKNFDDVTSSEHVWVVEFYAPWCGHCKQLAPEYEKAALNLKGLVRIAAVDCDVEKELCGKYEVKGFPTIKIFPSKSTPIPKKEGKFQKVPEDYQGQRTAAAIASFALSKLPSFVTAVSSSNEEKFLNESALPKAILFSNKGKTSDLYKALSIDFHNRALLLEAKHTDKKLVEKYGVTAFPTLFVLPKSGSDGGEPIKFEGKLSHQALFKFLEPHAIPAPKKESKSEGKSKDSKNSKDSKDSKDSKESKESKEGEPKVEPETGEIYFVNSQSVFDTHCVNKGMLCATAFLDYTNFEQEEIDKYTKVLTELGQKFKGKLRLFFMDGPSQPLLTKALDLSASYPSLVVLSPKKLRYTPFMGAFSLDSISEFFESVLRGKRSFAFDALPSLSDFTIPPKREPVREEEEEKVGKVEKEVERVEKEEL